MSDFGQPGAGPARIHIVGGPGSGKSTLARRVGERIGAPVYHLDTIHRIGGGNGPARSARERDVAVDRIVEGHRWVTEGVHLGWTDPLFEQADLVVWLDTVGWLSSSRRVGRRFVAGAAKGAREGGGRSAGRRLADATAHVRDVARAMAEARTYHRGVTGTPNLPETRRATQARLAWLGHRLVRCRKDADVERFVASLG